jgi:hypothetical protein
MVTHISYAELCVLAGNVLPYFPDRCIYIITHKDVPPPARHGFIGLSCFYRLPSTVATHIQIQHKNAYKWMAVSLRF